jgi:hypothetical protein
MAKSKLSLAETMEVAKIAIEDSSKIVIDRIDNMSTSPQSSRKRAKRSDEQTNLSGNNYWNSLNDSSKINHSDYDSIGSSNDWKDRLVTILKGKDEEIQDMREQLEIAEAEERRLKDMNALLESRLKSFHTTNSHHANSKSAYPSTSSSLASQSSQNHHSVAETSTSSNPTSQENQKLRDIISFYEKLTCMSVKPSLDEEHKYICTVKNHVKRAAIKFELESAMSTEIIFRPIANIHHLPEYLHGEISFEAAMAPVMMGDILQGLYGEDQSG